MYDELVNLLIRCGKQKCKNCEYEHVLGCVTKMNEKAADAIEELQKQRDEWESHAALAESFARGWIPVTERLPENGERVLVYSLYWGVREDLRFMGKFGRSDVTHWMPLPEPPKEET